ncbi:hypothetical protein [Nostoc sp.]|uniref:hypothetical protein n=1 Tax=Nostoc sp. TaxID=1180 RepID=UPI002FF53D04
MSTPALTVTVSTCLEPKGGFLTPFAVYQKAALEVRSSVSHFFSQARSPTAKGFSVRKPFF